VPFWAFDLKQDYRHLVERESGLLVLPWTEVRFNPLKPPPGVPPRRWIQVFAEIFGHATALLSGSKNHLMKKLVELYQLYNLFEDLSKPFPSLHELELMARREKINYVRKQSDYRDRILNRLEAMNLTAGTIFDCSQGYSIEDLLQQDVIFEFDGLSRDVQNFLMEILFAYVYEYRLAQNERGGDLRHILFLDEGKQVFSVYKERQDASGIPEIDELTAKMREFGEGLVVADQEASKLTDSIKANTYTKVLLPTSDRKQFTAMAESMNLSERQREFAQTLDVGEAVIQVGNHDPVPVNLEDYGLAERVSDEELEKLQAEEWNQLSHTPRDSTPEFEQFLVAGGPDGVEEPEIVDDPSGEVEVSEKADRLLKDVIENPFRALTKRCEDFSSRYKGNKAKNELVDSSLVIERQVRSQDSKRKLLQLTEKGREYAENSLDLDTEQRGRGGIIHRYWQDRIKDVFEAAGWTDEIERFDADIYASMGNRELVVEVAMGNNPREVDHVRQHLDTDFVVWVACRNPGVRDGLQQRMAENDVFEERVVFRLLRDFNNPENLPT
jgi:DNA-binding MarR family transcriptional regulator